MNTNKAAVKVRITAVILMVSCLFSLSSCYKEPVIEKSNSNSEINEYIEELVGIDLSPYMAESEMEVEKMSSPTLRSTWYIKPRQKLPRYSKRKQESMTIR